MPRDDLSIDFVKKMAPSGEAQDPAVILDDWIHRTQNLPEEIRFMQDEIADKDRAFNDCVKAIEENDVKIQRWIRLHGSHQTNPREPQLREIIRENFTRADKLAAEKIALAQKMQALYDKHLRNLDVQIKQLYDRGEPGFTDPEEMPSLLRPSAANNSNTSLRVLAAANTPLNPVSSNAAPSGGRGVSLHVRTSSLGQHASSAPASPAASMLLHRNQRESSAGAGSSGGPKRGPRANLALGSVPAASSGLARHSSLGPGVPKAGTPGATSRAGSAGPRGTSKGLGAGTGRKGTPSAGVARKKPPSKSTLSRVKRAVTSKDSPASTAESELSDADSLPSSRGGRTVSRAGSGTPVPHHPSNHSRHNSTKDADGDESMASGPADEEEASGISGPSDDEEDEEGKKYCLCQHVSYGDMVACDNPSCPYEWFHWNCVGLKSEPEGRWFCPACTESMRKKNK
ncbi:hypothetical protein DL771_002007 [Monosporascus sp. 5C6A]|nr:hypothetical protein DL771_002007 [Monosporascus sp. 5C6A]